MDIKAPKVGDIIEGKVIQVENNTIFLDIQYFTEAKMHIDNYDPKLESFEGVVKEGDVVRGKIQKIQLEPVALILMSRLPILKEQEFEKLVEAVDSGETVKGKVKKVLDKGIIVDHLGYEIFVPYTLLDFDLINKKDTLKGRLLEVNIIEATKRGRFTRIVGSRKEIFEKARQEAHEERLKVRADELESINTGDILTGTIVKLEKHAANVKFDNVVGMLRISQVSHIRIDELADVLSVGDQVQVKVIKKEGNRLDLSMKALIPTPFEEFIANHNVGDEVAGKIFQKLPFGLLVEVAEGVRGLLHKNEYSWNPADNFDASVNIGDDITLKILRIEKKGEKISLSKKALDDNPWKNVSLKRGDVVSAKVINVSDKVLEVEVDGVSGFISAQDALAENQTNLDAYFSVGDTIDEALVVEANPKTWSLKLSITELSRRKERAVFEKYLEESEEDSGQTIGDLFGDDLK